MGRRQVVYVPKGSLPGSGTTSKASTVVGVVLVVAAALLALHGKHHHPAAAPAPAGKAATTAHDSTGYVNPLAGQGWTQDRIDQGWDLKPAHVQVVRAIGPGVVVWSDPHSGWPGGGWITYRLTAGPAKDRVVFVAEHLTRLLKPGTRLWPGRPIAYARPGFPYTEWGWADCGGGSPYAPYNGAADGTDMTGGLEFARFMHHLGADPPRDQYAEDPGRGPAIPPACPGR